MKHGDKFKFTLQDGHEINYEICGVQDFIKALETSTQTVPFDDPQRRCIGFIVEGRAVAMSISDIKSCLSSMPEWFRNDISTHEGRARIASHCSVS
jgi:hypothetical protein